MTAVNTEEVEPLTKAERKAKRRREKERNGGERIKKHSEAGKNEKVKLQELTSISGGSGNNTKLKVCRKCEKTGHTAKNCPRKKDKRVGQEPDKD